MFEGFSIKELKYYFGFGFLFFILATFLFTNLFFSFIYDSKMPLYLVLILHDSIYVFFYLVEISMLAYFFRLNATRAMIFILPQFYIYEYLSGFFVQGLSYLTFTPRTVVLRIIILAIGIGLIYLLLRLIIRRVR
ncbi:MAG: hypothetical protein N2746_08030 [Deltaproteobacteria bacterium]|nr:hypothetical protein [Deltaproteobacteria bacterium]